MKFKLVESFVSYFNFGPDLYSILKNPTMDELNAKGSKGNRGWITPNGDLYVEKTVEEPYSSVIHVNLLDYLVLQKIFPEFDLLVDEGGWLRNPEEGVAVIRIGKSNEFQISESYDQTTLDDDFDFDHHFERILAKAQSKMPWLKFTKQSYGTQAVPIEIK